MTKNVVDVETLCNLCGNTLNVKVWDLDGHNMYDEFKTDKVNKSPFKFHEVLCWQIQYGELVIYIENDAIEF